ncbi:hypothetical protein D1AOALGA4SA_2076 [Olavius algarvensis Delta 1 endosymbiont]|nr:hypothetical protein D1AOALGA4SA_2076 [Olavius algarvensis Delta 1 endosymbiont]
MCYHKVNRFLCQLILFNNISIITDDVLQLHYLMNRIQRLQA